MRSRVFLLLAENQTLYFNVYKPYKYMFHSWKCHKYTKVSSDFCTFTFFHGKFQGIQQLRFPLKRGCKSMYPIMTKPREIKVS